MENKPQVSVQEVNEAVSEAGNVPLSKKQQEKQEKQAKAYWNTMISRKEAYEMVQAAVEPLSQQMQLLFVQNRTLLELLDKKGIATEQEINDASREVLISIFGEPPTDEKEKEEATDNA